MNKETYYVNLESQSVNKAPIPDGTQLEIFATKHEADAIRNKFNEMQQSSKEALFYVAHPFNEKPVDNIREDYQEKLISLYRLIYNVGTTETRNDIDQLGFVHFP